MLILLFSFLCALIAAQDYAPFKCDAKQMSEYENTLQLRAINASMLVGYTEVRRELEQILVGPIQYPNEYSGLLGGGRGVLLFGPPGTGKTLLISTMVDKLKLFGWKILKIAPTDISTTAWRGEAEKRLECIFNTARTRKNIILLFDEGESMFPDRSQVKDSYLANLVSIALTQMNDMSGFRVVVITNIPTTIDSAIRRRVGFNFCMRFPTTQERKDLFCKFLLDDKWRIDQNFTYQKYLDRSTIFSGDDINRLCATMCRDKIVGVDMPFRTRATPFNDADVEAAMFKVKSLSSVDMLKQIASYASQFSNPCLTEYLSTSKRDMVKRAWATGEDVEGESPAIYVDNLAYQAASKNLLEVSYNPEESYFQAMTGQPSRYCGEAVPDDDKTTGADTVIIIAVVSSVCGLLLLLVILYFIVSYAKRQTVATTRGLSEHEVRLLNQVDGADH